MRMCGRFGVAVMAVGLALSRVSAASAQGANSGAPLALDQVPQLFVGDINGDGRADLVFNISGAIGMSLGGGALPPSGTPLVCSFQGLTCFPFVESRRWLNGGGAFAPEGEDTL